MRPPVLTPVYFNGHSVCWRDYLVKLNTLSLMFTFASFMDQNALNFEFSRRLKFKSVDSLPTMLASNSSSISNFWISSNSVRNSNRLDARLDLLNWGWRDSRRIFIVCSLFLPFKNYFENPYFKIVSNIFIFETTNYWFTIVIIEENLIS